MENPIPPEFILKQMNYTKDEYEQLIINNNSLNKKIYFPEYKLVKYLFEKYNLDIPIYVFLECGIKFLTDSYNQVIYIENIDTIILVDGGTDSLMDGTEKDENGYQALGTPFEDISSIIAVNNSNNGNLNLKKYLYCIGYNVDSFHGVKDENFLKNTAFLTKNNYFVGSYMLNNKNKSTKKYIETFMACDPENSIVNSHIISSLNGKFGNYHEPWIKHRLVGTVQNINPFMALYWIYELEGIYQNLKYDKNKLKETIEEYEITQLLKNLK